MCTALSHWKRIGVNSQFHTPIPILWNWFLECPNSNSTGGIGGSTPTPIPRNWGDSKGFHMFEFPSLHPGVTSSPKKPLVTPGSHLFSTFSTDSKHIGIIPTLLNWSWSCSTNSKTGIWMGGKYHSKICKWNWNWWNCSNDWTYSTVCKSNLGPFPLHLGPIPHYEYCIGTYSTVSIFHLGPIPQSQNSFWDLFHSLIFFLKHHG